VRVFNRQRRMRVARRELEAFLEEVMESEAAPRGLGIEVTLVRDDRIREVNRLFLGRDRPTDVLAFPYTEARDAWGSGLLGEILVSTDQVFLRRGDPERALVHLCLHGLLHLLGYDHHRPAQARRMRRAELRYLRRWGRRRAS
jgi:rRNA maturation RNase YbeY